MRKPGGGLTWSGIVDNRELMFDEEPETSWWLRTQLLFLSPIVPHSQL
jgi:hypothetical protein